MTIKYVWWCDIPDCDGHIEITPKSSMDLPLGWSEITVRDKDKTITHTVCPIHSFLPLDVRQV